MKIRKFRALIIIAALLYLFSIAYPYVIDFPEGSAIEAAFRWDLYNAIYIPHPFVLIAMLLLTISSLVSLVFFSRTGRLIFTIMIFLTLSLSLFTGLSIFTPLQSFIGTMSCLSLGGVLVSSWSDDLSLFFKKEKS